jgi:hypothetical protein
MPTLVKPVFKPGIDFQVQTESSEEKSTIVHFTVHEWTAMRIWPTTYLVQEDGQRKKLLQAYNITEYPYWKFVDPGHTFTLVFEGLDKSCLLFDLLEDIPEEGGFNLPNIERNRTDVYRLDI